MVDDIQQEWKKCKNCGALFFAEYIVHCRFCPSLKAQDDTGQGGFEIVCLSIREVVKAACTGIEFATTQPVPFYPYQEEIRAARAALTQEPVSV